MQTFLLARGMGESNEFRFLGTFSDLEQAREVAEKWIQAKCPNASLTFVRAPWTSEDAPTVWLDEITGLGPMELAGRRPVVYEFAVDQAYNLDR